MDYTIRAQRILIFADTCHSGAALDRGGANDGKSLNFFNKYLEVLAKKKGRLVLTASQAHENSLETTKLAHGVFTNSILAGLAGAADDNPADGVVTAGELVDYVQAKVPEETAGEQHPSYSQQGFDMNFPLAYVRTREDLETLRKPGPSHRMKYETFAIRIEPSRTARMPCLCNRRRAKGRGRSSSLGSVSSRAVAGPGPDRVGRDP